MNKIPVFEPEISLEEKQAVNIALERGEVSGSFGSEIPKFESDFANYVDCNYGVAVTSGTTALHLAVDICDFPEDSEILVSASTNIATALAVHHNNFKIIPVDSEEITWNLDLDKVEELITDKTVAIIPVHLFGHPVDMERLMSIAERHNLIVIEDCAEAHGAKVNGKIVGSFGHMACFSFYANKIISTGEGGMITTNNKDYYDKLKLYKNLGFTQPRFYHNIAGYNFRMTGLQAALGNAQLAKIDRFVETKRWIAKTYNEYLGSVKEIQTPAELDWAKNVYWMYAITFNANDGKNRDGLMTHLKNDGIDTRTFFCPMNLQPFLEAEKYSCPIAENIWKNGLYLPCSYNISEDQIKRVCTSIKTYLNK